MGRPEIIPRLTRRGKVHRAKQIYGTPEIMVDEKLESSPASFPNRNSALVLAVFSLLPSDEAVRFHESVDHGRIFSQFIFFSF